MGENLDRTIEVESEMKPKYISKYNNIDSDMSSCKINVSNPIVKKYADNIISIINEGNTNITGDINTATTLLQSIGNIEETDLTIEDFDFNGWINYDDQMDMYDLVKINGRSEEDIEKALTFFNQFDNCKIDGMNVYVGDYRYNINERKLYCQGKKNGIPLDLHIPTKDGKVLQAEDYSHLNTITVLSGTKSGGSNGEHDINNKSNAIILALGEGPFSKNALNDQMTSNVTSATKFVNLLTGTDLDKCQNIIIGGSQFGAKSLRIAAQSGDLYKTVVCVNNAVIVAGENAGKTSKERFANIEELRGLDGKNVYLISTKMDPNLTMDGSQSGGTYDKNKDITTGFVYTGTKLLVDNCPNASIHLITNNEHEEFKYIQGENYYYDDEKVWNGLAGSYVEGSSSNDHAQYHNIIRDTIGSVFGGYNEYTANFVNK